jgi:hypothetical protein
MGYLETTFLRLVDTVRRRKLRLEIGIQVHQLQYMNFKSDSQLLTNLVNRGASK